MVLGIFSFQVFAEALKGPDDRIELRLPLPEHCLADFTWSARVPGKGTYMGPVAPDQGERYGMCITLDDPDIFIPEKELGG